jgi:AraC family transcriptional activator of pyochelin receptor
MKIRFSVANLAEWMALVREKTGAIPGTDSDGDLLEFPQRLGTGYLCCMQVRPGFEVTIHDSEFHEPLLFEGEYLGHRPIGLSFCLSGRTVYSMRGVKEVLRMEPQRSLLLLGPPDFYGAAEYAIGQRIQLISIGVEPSILSPFLESQRDNLPSMFTRLVEDTQPTRQPVYCQLGAISPAIHIVLKQMLSCPYQGVMKRLYFEGKALELMALTLTRMLADDHRQPATLLLRPDDIERIHKARDVLLDKMDEPPSLLALARQVGLNDFKLKRGFRQVFGTTAFGYLHEQRMERARQLLEERRLNVTEVACTVGYANPSHFAGAFKRRFGVNPSAYLSRLPASSFRRHSLG